MKRNCFFIGMLCAMMAFSGVVFAQTSSNPVVKKHSISSASKPVTGSVANTLQGHFTAVRENFSKDKFLAASHIRRAAALVDKDSRLAQGEAKKELLASKEELMALAKGIENGTVTDIQQVESVMSKVETTHKKYQKA